MVLMCAFVCMIFVAFVLYCFFADCMYVWFLLHLPEWTNAFVNIHTHIYLPSNTHTYTHMNDMTMILTSNEKMTNYLEQPNGIGIFAMGNAWNGINFTINSHIRNAICKMYAPLSALWRIQTTTMIILHSYLWHLYLNNPNTWMAIQPSYPTTNQRTERPLTRWYLFWTFVLF